MLKCQLLKLKKSQPLRGRVNTIRRKRFPLDTGIPGVNLEFGNALIPAGYFTPRHRHNFEQIRFTLDGIQSTGHGDLPVGTCGYFPEGAYYGPQEQKEDSRLLCLQFQGPSGEHFLNNDEANAMHTKLVQQGGSFDSGFFRGKKADGKRYNKDSYTAIWENFVGQKLVIPKGRYRTPVMMSIDNYRWVPSRHHRGVFHKHLGTFSELRTSIGFVRMTPGATLPAQLHEDAEVRYLLEGAVTHGGRTWTKDTYFYIPWGSSTEAIKAVEDATFFTIGLPMLRDWEQFTAYNPIEKREPVIEEDEIEAEAS